MPASPPLLDETSTNPLEEYFNGHREGRGIWKWRHYLEIYHHHLSKFVGTGVHVLEIGVYSGGSLGMWRDYFGSGSAIYGVDIAPECREYEDPSQGVRIFIGDQADTRFWDSFKEEVPRLDVVIDDGGHRHYQQIPTLEALLPFMAPGGVYICEDIHSEDQAFYAYVMGLASNLHASKPLSGYEQELTPFQRRVASVHVYSYMTVIELGARPPARYVAPRHGSEWQPFLSAAEAGGSAVSTE